MFAPDPTGYVTTRWYRAPEILMADKNYTHAIDLWSVGCIIVEMFTRQPLLSGRNYVDQLQRQVNLLGRPRPEDLTRITNESARQFVLHCPRDASTPSVFALLAAAIGDPSAPYLTDLMHLLAILLAWDPRNRRSAAELIDPTPHQTYEARRAAAAAAAASPPPAVKPSALAAAAGAGSSGTEPPNNKASSQTEGPQSSTLTPDGSTTTASGIISATTATTLPAGVATTTATTTQFTVAQPPTGDSGDAVDDALQTFRVAGAVALPATPPPPCLPIPFVMGGITIYERAFKVGADGVPLHGTTPAPEAILAHGGQLIAVPTGSTNDSLRDDMARAVMMAYNELCCGQRGSTGGSTSGGSAAVPPPRA
jgi:hypothetical protein